MPSKIIYMTMKYRIKELTVNKKSTYYRKNDVFLYGKTLLIWVKMRFVSKQSKKQLIG